MPSLASAPIASARPAAIAPYIARAIEPWPAMPCWGPPAQPSSRRDAVSSPATQDATPRQAASTSVKHRTKSSSSPYQGSSTSNVPAATATGSNSRSRWTFAASPLVRAHRRSTEAWPASAARTRSVSGNQPGSKPLAIWADPSYPRRRSSATARRSMGLPTSQRVVPAESTVTSRPASRNRSRRITSPIGERQMLPVQTTVTWNGRSDVLVTSRVLALPPPRVRAHVVDRPGRHPAELVVGPGRVGPEGREVSGPTADDVVRDRHSRGAFERLDQLQHRGAPARPEVPGANRLVGGRDPVECRDMAGGEVLDVDVVALAGAVGRGVVVAEDAQPVATTHGDLRDERHEVVGDPLRVLADRAGRVRADGVEVAQDRDAPGGVDVRDIAQHRLDHHLGPPVRAVGLEGFVVLAIGHRSLVAVHGRGRGEHQRRAAVPAHSSQQGERRPEVVLVVVQWQLHTFTDGLQAGEVDDRVDLLRGEE